jgi:acetyltransferase-like isoleucine patch superfamily enzyme
LGATIGSNCLLIGEDYGTEPYLVTIGENVIVALGVQFITHDASVRALGPDGPGNLFGRITVGSWCFIGQGAILLPGTSVGDHSIIGAGAVVRGGIPSGSVAIGNPAVVVRRIDEFARSAEARSLPLDWGRPLRPQLECLLPDSTACLSHGASGLLEPEEGQHG